MWKSQLLTAMVKVVYYIFKHSIVMLLNELIQIWVYNDQEQARNNDISALRLIPITALNKK